MEKKVVVFGFIIILLFITSVLILDQFPANGGTGQDGSVADTGLSNEETGSATDEGHFSISIYDFLKDEMGVYYDENGDIVVEDRGFGSDTDVAEEEEVGIVEDVIVDDSMKQPGESGVLMENGSLEVHFIDVGQGSCTLIVYYDVTGEPTDAMLIDSGYYQYGTKVQNYIQKLGIDTLDYVVGTHPDSDHIGAMDVIITKFDCGTILLPEYQRDDIGAWYYMKQAMEQKYYTYSIPTVGDTYTLGGAFFTVLSPSKLYEECNDNSIVIKLEYGDTSFLFPGDAEEFAETDIVNAGYDLSCDVYQVSHHGSNTSTSQVFLDAVSPMYAVISCAENNDYFHPHGAVLNRLRDANVQLFRTDEQGSIICTSDGTNLIWNCSPSTTWQAGQ